MVLDLRASWALASSLMIDVGRWACDGEGVEMPLLPLGFLSVVDVVTSCLIIALNARIIDK